ncbi:MAG: CHRD domain-containing protein [Candidatus Krumholzibacteriota bacterium]|nr:CHRD domain-containing protein [Candidatus Krumholzibacteriota bacterium]
MRGYSIVVLLFAALVVLPSAPARAGDDGHDCECYCEKYDHVFKAKIRGYEEVPPVSTKAHGNFVAHLDANWEELCYHLVLNSIENVTAAHIHLGMKGENGLPVVTLYGPMPSGGGRINGNVARGVITAADLGGRLAGEPLHRLIEEIEAGNAYVNVHTDGHPGGEIRGQITLRGTLPPKLARLQVVHNAADPAAGLVDVWVNGALLLDDFAFRTATPFVVVPAEVPLSIGVAPPTSMCAGDAIATFDVTLDPWTSYVAVANGVLDPAAFAANPDGRETGFTLFVKAGAREAASCAAMVDLFVLHGSTDAPTVDVYARDVGRLVDDAAYGDMTGYLEVNAQTYVVNITPGGSDTPVVASYIADLGGLGGGAAVVFASGFFDPSANGGGPGFGLFAALPDGTVIELPASLARLQVIHNAADSGADTVDVWVNGALLLDDFAFRTATPFVDVPGEVPLAIGVAPPTSTTAGDAIATFDVSLRALGAYIAVANGVLDPAAFAANPDGRETGFILFVKEEAREAAADPAQVDFFVLHGSTDAPTVDVYARDVGRLVDDAAYGDITDYLTVGPASYVLDITPGLTDTVIVASFLADLSGLGGGAAAVFASGFLDPAANGDGPGFGLFAALPDGTVIELPPAAPPTDGPIGPSRPAAGGRIALAQNRPNPFNPTTTIHFELAAAGRVQLRIYDVAGRTVATLVDGFLPVGGHDVLFEANGIPSGVYFYRLKMGSISETRKMLVIR